MKNKKLTIGIPTCGRPKALRNCLESIQKNIKSYHKIIVVDSLANEESLSLYRDFPDLISLVFDSPIGPSAARKLIIENSETPYLLFLDDDNEVTSGTIDLMLSYLEKNPEIDILGGVWREHGDFEKREIGQYLHFGQTDKKKVIYKQFLGLNEAKELGLDSIKVDVVLATMLVRCQVFDQIQFDPMFDFFYELLDFFMQCYQHEKNIHVLPEAIFEHKPIVYSSSTLRQKTPPDVDKQKFIEKWNTHPVGPLGFQSYLDSKKTLSQKHLFSTLKSKVLQTLLALKN